MVKGLRTGSRLKVQGSRKRKKEKGKRKKEKGKRKKEEMSMATQLDGFRRFSDQID
jgi:hypothetical protein